MLRDCLKGVSYKHGAPQKSGSVRFTGLRGPPVRCDEISDSPTLFKFRGRAWIGA